MVSILKLLDCEKGINGLLIQDINIIPGITIRAAKVIMA